ncbi:lipid-binding SYLF domain-containing protein [sulfur-oxidizing endosymbiont of Gigantopelta aegis]|uniref:lipid-binding SYLF domain-containing protein n=1 Tax=sulfur-oxidizing endosymbiont of Gigantopelta aegis TaxID=2794934 RepID=UPI0018DC47EB|nr:lipid-binding SYLF domain-containing protein [sulfur-oxidizing endosymbiont of Gigantopelta aegis]
MYNKHGIFIFSCLMFFSQQSSALGERLGEMASDVGDAATELGKSAGKVATDVGKSAGIGVDATALERDADAALNKLLKSTPAAAQLAKKAKGILIFPKILKAGLMVGGQHGEGVLKKNGKTVAYYNTVAGSYGFQAGAQSFSYAMFFMNSKAMDYLNSSDGWEVGVGPSIVVVDDGMARSMTSMTTTESVYVFTFGQGGLMAGAGLQGSKISQIHPQ